ncbi:hypothetical protein OV079_29410 [Nannocystis pusilla]|uniref:Uncharacterized protein n=1 Tax=Nannocystis pusilla TaxID=889268 RepID=A0A9X3IYJ6_9BACT|nr:hypothetical protein [Nannocystis pusilla]MCY1009612.1 hypothetical protein [Nannocystis pusilla]
MTPLVLLLLLFTGFGLFGVLSDRAQRAEALRRGREERRTTLKDFVVPVVPVRHRWLRPRTHRG